MNLEIQEARRAGSSLAQAARPGYRCDGTSAACRACPEPVEGPRFQFNFSCISPALQAGSILICRFPRALPWAKASRARLRQRYGAWQAFGAGSWPQCTSEIGGTSSPRFLTFNFQPSTFNVE